MPGIRQRGRCQELTPLPSPADGGGQGEKLHQSARPQLGGREMCARHLLRSEALGNFNFTSAEGNSTATNADAVTQMPAENLSSTPGYLSGEQVFLAQPFGPQGDQRAVRGASHRVFRDACSRGKEARDEV